MAGDLKIENSEPNNKVVSDSTTKVAVRDVASGKDVTPSDSTLAILPSRDATSSVTGETDQKSVAGQGVNISPTSCYNYQYPGYTGELFQADEHGYYNLDGSYTGNQSDNSSMVYYMPSGYNQYSSGTFMGVDGQCQQPYFSSSGYLQPSVSYGSEALPCYSWDPTFVGGVPNGTKAKSGPMNNALLSVNGLNPIKSNGTRLQSGLQDSKTRQPVALSNFSKPILHTQPHKPLKKVPYLGPDFQSTGIVKGLQSHVGKFSYSNPRQGVYRNNGPMDCRPNNGPMNYRPNDGPVNYRPDGKMCYRNDRYNPRENSNRNGGFEATSELTRGPRSQKNSAINGSVEKEDLSIRVKIDQYNRPDFQVNYEYAKFYVIKSFSEDNIHKCIKYDVWASTPNGSKKLDRAFHEAEAKANETNSNCPIFLFFSVNASGQFVGLAEMIGQVDFNKDMDFWQLDNWNGFFPVKWHIIKDVPNSQFWHIILENNENKAVTYSRNTQEIRLEQGLEMLGIFKNYHSKTTILDDFNFYENREKLHVAKRINNSGAEVYSNGGLQNPFKAAERKLGNERDPSSSIIGLTKNLSLEARLPNSVAPSLPPGKPF